MYVDDDIIDANVDIVMKVHSDININVDVCTLTSMSTASHLDGHGAEQR